MLIKLLQVALCTSAWCSTGKGASRMATPFAVNLVRFLIVFSWRECNSSVCRLCLSPLFSLPYGLVFIWCCCRGSFICSLEPELMQSFVMSLLCPCSSNSRHSLCAIEIYCCILQGAFLRFLSSSWSCVCQIFDNITLILLSHYCL